MAIAQMQTPRVYAPNEVINLALPARLVQIILDTFHKCPSLGLSFDLVAELLVEVEAQCQRQQPQQPSDGPLRDMSSERAGQPGNSYDRA